MPSDFQRKFSEQLQSGLRSLAERDQRRTLAEISGVNLCSNDYLGLAQSAALREAVVDAVANSRRIGGTGSRLLSGHAAVWDDLENEFANFFGTEAALYFGSGYAANIGLLTSLAGRNDIIFSDALNHASLIDGIRLSGAQKHIYPHVDLNTLESALRQHQGHRGRKLIVTETVFSMDGDVAPLREILALAERYGAGVILDEAHATAVHGPGGRGISAKYHDANNIVAVVHTCSKALASAGAFVCGSTALKNHLINHARSFLFTTALPPYMAAQVRAALHLAQGMVTERNALQENSRQFSATLRTQGWDTALSSTQIIPVIVGANEDALGAADFLQQQGFAVRAIRPPTVAPGSARLRFSLTAAITPGHLAKLTQSLQLWRSSQQPTGRRGSRHQLMRHHFFVTGTDTGVGKTTLSALLCAALDAVYWKPIQTGTLEGSDRSTVMRLAGIGNDRTLDEVYQFVPPVSPDLAARWAGVEIDLARINLPTSLMNDWLVVEGVGGVLVPINPKQFVLDLMAKFKLPVILAARSSLGTINHTLLTLAALHAAELPVHGVVLIGDQNRENRETIERFGHVRVIGEIPRLPNLHRTALMQVFLNHFDRAAFSQ